MIFYLHAEFATSLLLGLLLVCYWFATGWSHRASTPCFQEGTLSIMAAWGIDSRGSSTESARVTLLRKCCASRRSSTESARATLLRKCCASRGSSTESARGTLLQRSCASGLEASRLKFELQSRTSLPKTFQTTRRLALRRCSSSMLSFQLGAFLVKRSDGHKRLATQQ